VGKGVRVRVRVRLGSRVCIHGFHGLNMIDIFDIFDKCDIFGIFDIAYVCVVSKAAVLRRMSMRMILMNNIEEALPISSEQKEMLQSKSKL
jgi:hypothetical protein